MTGDLTLLIPPLSLSGDQYCCALFFKATGWVARKDASHQDTCSTGLGAEGAKATLLLGFPSLPHWGGCEQGKYLSERLA